VIGLTGEVRAGRRDDLEHIAPWTSETFEWGDYVPGRFRRWLTDPNSTVLVIPDPADRPIALCHAVMLSANEGWLEAARVHPGHRRSGLGSALNHAGVQWLAEQGAQVVRLAVEGANQSARNQVEKLEYRRVGDWHRGSLAVDPTRRCPAPYRLRPVAPSEIDAAWMFWANSDLALAGRELIPRGWQWRRARPEDLTDAARDGSFYQSPAGWVVARQSEPGRMETTFLATVTEDAPRLFEGLQDLGARVDVEEVSVKVPGAPWIVEAMTRAGARPEEVAVYAKAP
jgi:GNAT superfamily N-acetyltransferase